MVIYPRLKVKDEKSGGEEIAALDSVEVLKNVPQLSISASHIRRQIEIGKSVKYLLTEPVLKYVEEMHFYQK